MRLYFKSDGMFPRIKFISDRSFTGAEHPPEEALRYQFDHGVSFIKENDRGDIIAYAIVVKDAGEPYIWSIATLPLYRNKGIASDLIDEVITYYKELHEETLALTVNVNNDAQKLYFDFGFRVVKFIPRRYGTVAGLRMRRTL